MKAARPYFVSLLLMVATSVAWGQSAESLAAASTDVLKAAHVYPNPASEFVHVKFEQPVAREVSLELHSIIGNSLEVDAEVIDDFEVRVRVKDLPSGYYLLDVKKPGVARTAFKFLKR
jgi:hypothetical protein